MKEGGGSARARWRVLLGEKRPVADGFWSRATMRDVSRSEVSGSKVEVGKASNFTVAAH